MDGDLAGQLRRKIAQATHEKEGAKLDLEVLQRSVDGHLLRLNGLLQSGEVRHDRLVVAVQSFDADVASRVTSDTGLSNGTLMSARGEAPASEGCFDVLRSSLADAQKRCQVLSGDMLRVADANEELMGTLKTLKGTNKRLVEEVQKQTEELSVLTQHRLHDNESLSILEDNQRREREAWTEEARRLLEEERGRGTEEFDAMRLSLTGQLEHVWRDAKVVATKTGTLRTLQSQLKANAQSFNQNVSINFKKLERDLVDKIQCTAKVHAADESKLKDAEHNLGVKHRAEREVRENETGAWKERHKALSGELEEVTQRREREVSGLQSKVDAVHATREAEAKASSYERQELYDQAEGLAKDVAHTEAMMQTAQRRGLQLESHLAQAEGERDRLESHVNTLKQQTRESDEALGEAYRSNEALREQMEIQRLDAHQANERDLKLCREMFSKRLEVQQQGHQSEHDDLNKRIHQLEGGVAMKASDLQAGKEGLADNSRVRDALQRDMLLWKAQHELAAKTKSDVERELQQHKQESLQGELKRLQEQQDELAAKKSDHESRLASIHDEHEQAKHAVKTREMGVADRAGAVADLHRETAAEHHRTRAAVQVADDSLAQARAEAATSSQQLNEKREGLEQELTRLSAEHEQEKRDLESKIHLERLNSEGLRDSFEKLRVEHSSSYRAAFDGPVQQISAVEGAINDLQRISGTELSGLRHKSQKYGQRVDELEGELGKCQAQLAKSEREVQEGTARVNLAKATHRAARESLERERTAKQEELMQAQRTTGQKSEQLKSLGRAGEDIRKKILRSSGEASKYTASQQATLADRRY